MTLATVCLETHTSRNEPGRLSSFAVYKLQPGRRSHAIIVSGPAFQKAANEKRGFAGSARETTMSTRKPSKDTIQRLRLAALNAAGHAYAPYSKFRVGAACLTRDGQIHSGANVENASYGLSMCAERNAVFRSVAAGNMDIVAVVVYTPTALPTTPCGACRQVICEFGDTIHVICCCDGPEIREFISGELLPDRFKL
jgi:cytidine deaminase